MDMQVYITVEALERIALSQPLYAWHYGVRPFSSEAVEGSIVGQLSITLPSKEDCIQPVLTKLAAKEQEIQAQAYADVKEIQDRRNALLMIGFSEPATVPTPPPFTPPWTTGTLPEDWRDLYTCVCTGCEMISANRVFWGDLWRRGDTYLYNATSEEGEALEEQTTDERSIIMNAFLTTRDGKMFVCHEDYCSLTPPLTEYINSTFIFE